MKKTPFLLSFTAILMATGVANANVLKADSVACISEKYLSKYERFVESEENVFVKDMLGRAQCYVNKREIQASVLNEVGDHVRLELIDGHRVWTAKASLVTEKAE